MADDIPRFSPDGTGPGNPVLPPVLAPGQPPTLTKGPSPGDMKDGSREVIETIVFVVVLVLLLKTFLAEAFVIPTGSMATTLLGYHWDVTCERCGYQFLANGSSEGEGKQGQDVTKCICRNCRFLNTLRRPEPKGDQQ